MGERIWNSKLFQWFMGVVASVIIVIITMGINVKSNYNKSIKIEIDKKASIEYVKEQDTQIRDNLKQHIQESDKQIQAQTELIKSIDGNVKILINKIK
jgi:chorismate synthase